MYCISRRAHNPLSEGRLMGSTACTACCWSWLGLSCWSCGCSWMCCTCGKDCNVCCIWGCCDNLCCWILACNCGFWRPWICNVSCLCNICRISSDCLMSSLDFFWACNGMSSSRVTADCSGALEAPCTSACSWCWCWLCFLREEPSTIEEPKTTLEEKDMGEAGSRADDSLLMLVLLCNRGRPESAELASVTSELAPILGPEEFVPLFRAPQFISREEGPRPDWPFPDTQFPVAGLWPSPWKKTPEADEDCDGPPPPATLAGAIEGVPVDRQLESTSSNANLSWG